MRYRIKEYILNKNQDAFEFGVRISKSVYDSLVVDENTGYLNAASLRNVVDSIRLIADETRGGYIVCSTGLKNVVDRAYKFNNVVSNAFVLVIVIPKANLIAAADGDENDLAAIDAMVAADQFTIEMDWGESPSDLVGGGGEIDIMTDAEHAPALEDLGDMIDALDEEES